MLMGLADDVDHRFPLRGTLDFVNNTVDPQTGTHPGPRAFRESLSRQAAVLVPGLFVRVRLGSACAHKWLLISERAIVTDQGQKFVFVVDKENKISLPARCTPTACKHREA